MTKSRTLRKAGAVALSLAMAFSVAGAIPANAAAKQKVTLSATKKVFKNTGGNKAVKIKGVAKKNIKKTTVATKNKNVATVKKNSNVKFTVTAKKNTTTKVKSTKIVAKVVLKKLKYGKKTYAKKKWTLKFTVKVKAGAAPTTAPTATPAPVPATAITLDQTEATVVEGQTITLNATLTPPEATDAIEWSTSDATIATVEAGVVTGVKAGEVNITAKAGEFTAVCKVTVTAATVEAKLVDAKQTAANGMTLTFDIDTKTVTGGFKKEDILVKAADGTLDIPVTNATVSEDGKTVDITLSTPLTNAKEYNVTYKSSSFAFTASVGAVNSVLITTTTAEQNVETKIAFKLLDEKGIDVTSTVDVSGKCSVTVDGDCVSNTADAKKSTVTMDTVGKKVTVTVKYDSQVAGSTPIEAKQEITCVEAKALVGEGIFAQTGAVNAKSGCAKFYKSDVVSKEVSVTVDSSVDNVYFYAKDKETGKALNYTEYKVSSSNDDVASATIEDNTNTGKFVRLKVNGTKVGSANIIVTGVQNGKETPYAIPVVVKEKAVPKELVLNLTKTPISNTYDEAYGGIITAYLKDSNGNNAAAESVSFKITNQKDNNNDVKVDTNAPKEMRIGFGFTDNGKEETDSVSKQQEAGTWNAGGYQNEYHAWGAASGTYNIEATAITSTGESFTKKTSVEVKALAAAAWAGGAGTDVTYGIEVSNAVLDQSNGTKNGQTAKLCAYVNNLFAGYVTNGSSSSVAATIGSTKAMDGVASKAVIKNFTISESASYGSFGGKNIEFKKVDANTKTTIAMVDDTSSLDAGKFVFVDDKGLTKDITFTMDVTNASTQKNYVNVTSMTAGSEAATVYVNGIPGKLSASDVKKAFSEIKAASASVTIPSNVKTALNNMSVVNGKAWTDPSTLATAKMATVTGSANILDSDKNITYYAAWTKDSTIASIVAGTVTFNVDKADKTTGTIDGLLGGKATFTRGYSTGTYGPIAIAESSLIYQVGAYVKSGTNFFSTDADTAGKTANLYYSKDNAQDEKTVVKGTPAEGSTPAVDPTCLLKNSAKAVITMNSVDESANRYFVIGDTTNDAYFAKPIQYVPTFTYKKGKDKKDDSMTTTVTVTNKNIFLPTATVNSRAVDSTNESDLKKVIETNVDLNNKNGLSASVLDGFYATFTGNEPTKASASGNKITVKYIPIEEDGIIFYYNLGTTFTVA